MYVNQVLSKKKNKILLYVKLVENPAKIINEILGSTLNNSVKDVI